MWLRYVHTLFQFIHSILIINDILIKQACMCNKIDSNNKLYEGK